MFNAFQFNYSNLKDTGISNSDFVFNSDCNYIYAINYFQLELRKIPMKSLFEDSKH